MTPSSSSRAQRYLFSLSFELISSALLIETDDRSRKKSVEIEKRKRAERKELLRISTTMKSVQSPQCFLLLLMLPMIIMTAPVAELEERQEERHFGFQTDNGQQRSEDITYKVIVNTDTAGRSTEEPDGGKTPKPVEYRGGYSFISADGYEYQVRYKANQNGFQPYVTAHKVQSAETKNKV